jgi:CRP-like cAMP-binding protein
MANQSTKNGNLLIEALPQAERRRILTRTKRIDMEIRKLVYAPNRPIEHVYFPETAVLSLISHNKGQLAVEIGTVGNEGMAGIPLFLGASSIPATAFAQVAGTALQMRADDFRKETANGGALQRILHRYTQAFFIQLAQSVACNRLHSIQQRCARWLLMTHDRVEGDQFVLSQMFLAQMLGVRRATVNPVLQGFQRAGVIKYRQAKMEIRDRRKLERASCDCYQIVRKEYHKLIGPAR